MFLVVPKRSSSESIIIVVTKKRDRETKIMYAVAFASSAKVVAQTTRTNSAQTKRASAKPAKALKNPTVEKVTFFRF